MNSNPDSDVKDSTQILNKIIEELKKHNPNYVLLEALIKKYKNLGYINLKDNYGCPLIIYLIKYGYLNLIKQLIQAGADINICDANGKTALMWACSLRLTKIVSILIESDIIDINSISDNGQTSLMFAVMIGHTKICQILMVAGADPGIIDNDGKIAYDYTKPYDSEIKQLLQCSV